MLVKMGRSLDQYDVVKYETHSKTVTKVNYCGSPVILKVNREMFARKCKCGNKFQHLRGKELFLTTRVKNILTSIRICRNTLLMKAWE